jgi:hypothetical protein
MAWGGCDGGGQLGECGEDIESDDRKSPRFVVETNDNEDSPMPNWPNAAAMLTLPTNQPTQDG